MNNTAAAFAAEIAPYFARTLRDGLTTEDALTAAVLLWKEDQDREFAHRLTRTHLFTEALSGTYDEFRAEAAA